MGRTGTELAPGAAALGPLTVVGEEFTGERDGDEGRDERDMRGVSIEIARSKAPPPRSFSLPSFPSLLLELPGELERDVRP